MRPGQRVTVHCIGNAHLDPVWRWRWEEGYAETLATCRAALDRLHESDDFIFTRGEAATLAWIEEAAPDLFEEIRKYVAEGRWHIVGGWWEQPDCNIPAGESYVRHALYGKRWFREKLGVEVRTGWNPDSFGHNGGLPQILARSGYQTYCFFRPGAEEKGLPSPFFWWQGRDGSRILAIRPPIGHYSEWQDDLGDLVRRAAEEARELGLAHAIVCYGVGNHGGGPTRRSIASLRALRDDPAQPKAIFSTIDAFRAAIEGDAAGFPTLIDDLQHHAPGCYTSHSEVKRLNRLAENRLLAAERWSALASLALGLPYPVEEFGRAWKQVLFNQFHDTLAGTSLPAAYEDARDRFGDALSVAGRLQNAALQALAAHVDTRIDSAAEPPEAATGRPIVLFNPSSWQRSDAAAVQWGWPSQHGNRLLDESGANVPFQLGQPDVFPAGSRIHFEATLPPHGYRVYRLVPSEAGSPAEVTGGDGPRALAPASLENRFYRIDLDPERGCVTRILDKRHGVEVLRAPGCELVVLDDPGDTWGHGIGAWRSELGRFRSAEIRRLEDGPARATLRVDTRWRRSTARQEISLHRESPRIDVALTIDWQERHQMLKLSVPVAVAGGTLSFDAPYSVIERPMTGGEEPGQAWIDLTGAATTASGTELRYGVSLLNDAKFGFDCKGGDLRMTLLRSPIYCFHEPAEVSPDQEYRFLDQGTQSLRYALLPHAGGWEEAGTAREAHALNNPFVDVFQYPHAGDWGPRGALLSVDPPAVIASVLKGAEEGDALVLRLFESEGTAVRATIRLPGGLRFETPLGAFELKTLRLERDGRVRETDLLEG